MLNYLKPIRFPLSRGINRIKFFRKIRRNLLTQNKRGTYLWYAIGEIVLVVIGVLIALQINNNSKNHKKREFEITILENIKLAILADKVDCEQNLEYLKTELTNEQFLFDFLLGERIQPLDSLDYGNALEIDLLLSLYNASFNNIQNNVIGLITDNNLYKKITRFYDFYVASLNKLENKHDCANTYKNKLVFFEKHVKVITKKTTIFKDSYDDDSFK